MSDVECPYCGEGQDINHDDGYGYDEARTYEQECGDCEKTFVYETSIIFSYEASTADCLNGGEHDWYAPVTYPRKYTRMTCRDCDLKRKPTDSEMERILSE